MPQRRIVVALLTLLIAATASAALSPQYTEWRNGPIQWIMTGAEKGAWKKVSSDEAASNFIDLFWARRDPTPGTPQNEARDEHEARVKHAEETFKERGKRGALTDRGRVWTVLGPPPNLNLAQGRITSTTDSYVKPSAPSGGGGRGQGGGVSGRIDPSGGRQLGARDAWIWEHADASARFGLPRVEIVFVTDPGTGKTIRDLFRRDFSAAEQAVMKKQIVEDYQTLPEWAAIGGLTPRIRASLSGPAPAAAPKPAISQSAAPAVATPVSTAPAKPRGATRLTLTRNVYDINAQSSGDPFAALEIVDRFKTTDELGWVAQYCGQADQELSVPFMISIKGKGVDLATPLESVVPDRIQSSPGCYMLRGAIPLSDMAAGTYVLHLMVDDPIVKSDSYDLKRQFWVE
jgi:GWxTD domain-containing protein